MSFTLLSSARLRTLLPVLTPLVFAIAPSSVTALSLQEAQQLAIQYDPWQQTSSLQEQALRADSSVAATMSDPVLSVGLANLPTDGFQFNQEGMTQLKVGLSQQFARGDSREIKRRQLLNLAAKHPLLRADRQEKLKVMVGKLWLDAFTAQQRMDIVAASRPLFVQLSDIVEASYGSAQGRTRQQDVIQAQVELARLDDRLSALETERDSKLASLAEWLYQNDNYTQGNALELSDSWPQIDLPDANVLHSLQQRNKTQLAQLLARHPAMLAVQQQINSQLDGVELAKQKYQAQWGVNVSYAYRDNDVNGTSRADFFSVGLSVDLPFFTSQRQDKEVESASLQAEAAKTEQLLLLRNLLAQALNNWQAAEQTQQRIQQFEQVILPQLSEQADATLNAYTTDNGDFGDVMRSRITQLNTELDLIKLQNELAQYQLQLLYYFKPTHFSIKQGYSAPVNQTGDK
ncbi:TolC family protein [Paraglaciecola sp.]|uniref:TolC family protein n=1 Tax=Paraglaciecola sp. TaxID=1920173 RepID=UPI0030F49D3D